MIFNEFFSMTLARACGLPTSDVEIINIDNLNVLSIRRYDRETQDGHTIRLHQEDMCQALGLMPNQKYQTGDKSAANDILRIIRFYTSNPIENTEVFIKWMVFNYLIGNNDAHLKNISILYGSGTVAIAPFYDMLSTEIYANLNHTLAIHIDGAMDSRDVRAIHWQKMLKDLNLNTEHYRRLIGDFAKMVSSKATLINTDFAKTSVGKKQIKKIISLAQKRANVVSAILQENIIE